LAEHIFAELTTADDHSLHCISRSFCSLVSSLTVATHVQEKTDHYTLCHKYFKPELYKLTHSFPDIIFLLIYFSLCSDIPVNTR